MRFGIDYSLGKPNLAEAKKAGVTFICRYLSTAGNPKNLTAAETVAAKALGLDIVLVFETTANRAVDGWNAGVVDATSAQAQAGLLGLAGAPIYFAVDFDVPDYAPKDSDPKKKLGPVGAYLEGAASVLGKPRTGVYGGYWVVKRAFDAGIVTYGWQSFAWSGGQWDPRAQLQQFKNGQSLAGGSVDYNNALVPDFGQATLVAPTPVPVPTPTPAPTPAPVPPKPAPYSTVALRQQLRSLILNWNARGVSWARIVKTNAYQLFRHLGGK